MVIDEQDAFRVFRELEQIPEESRPRAASMLADYRTQQEREGLPLWPTQEKAKIERKSKIAEIFGDPLKLDADDGSYVQADRVSPGLGDKLRKREANILFLADRYGADEADVRNRLDFYKADASEKWGGVVLDDGAFFAKAKGEVDQDTQKIETIRSAADSAVMSALKGGDGFSDFAAWQVENEANPAAFDEAAKAWNQTRESVLKKLGPDGMAAAKRGVRALRNITGAGAESDAWFNQARSELIAIKAADPAKYQLVLSAMQAMGQTETDGEKGVLQGVGEKLGRGVEAIAVGAVESTQIASARLAGMGVTNADDPKALEASIRAGIDVDGDLRDLVNGVIDPVGNARTGYAEKGLYMAAGSLPYMVSAMVPGGQVAIAGSFTADAYRDFRRAGWEGADAETAAVLSGVFQAKVERASEVLIKVPGVAGVMAKFGVKPGSNWAGQFLIRSGARSGIEFTEEIIQEATSPFIQELAASVSASVPDRPEGQKLKDVMAEFMKKENTAPLIISIIPLGMIGAGMTTSADMRTLQDTVRLFGEKEAAAIMAETDVAKRDAMIRERFNAMSSKDMAKAAADLSAADIDQTASVNAALQRAEELALIPKLRRDSQGWAVEDSETGAVVRVSNREEAVSRVFGHLDEQEQRRAQAGAELWDEIYQGGAEALKAEAGDMTTTRLAQRSAGDAEWVRRGVETYAQLHGLTPEEASQAVGSVMGFNREETIEGVRSAVSSVFGRGMNVGTVLHEATHGRWKAGLDSGRFTHKQGVAWVRMAEAATGLDFLPSKVDADISPEVLDEAIVDVTVSDSIGRRKAGGKFSAGLISRGMASMARSERAEAKQAGKFATWLKSWRDFWGVVINKGKALKKARDEGKLGDDFDSFLDELLDVSPQARHEAMSSQEALAIVDSGNAPFSLGYLGNVQDSGNVQLKAVDLARGTHESEGLDQGSEGMGTFRYRKDNETIYWHLPPGDLRKESAASALERKGFNVKRQVVMVYGSESALLAHGLDRELANAPFSMRMASNEGAPQSNEPSPGGLTETEVQAEQSYRRELKTLVERKLNRDPDVPSLLTRDEWLDVDSELTEDEILQKQAEDQFEFDQYKRDFERQAEPYALLEAADILARAIGFTRSGMSNVSEATYWNLPDYDLRLRLAAHDVVNPISGYQTISLDSRDWVTIADVRDALLDAKKQIIESQVNPDSLTQPRAQSGTFVDSGNAPFSLAPSNAKDSEYLAAVEAGDMEKAQRMVGEADADRYKSARAQRDSIVKNASRLTDSPQDAGERAALKRSLMDTFTIPTGFNLEGIGDTRYGSIYIFVKDPGFNEKGEESDPSSYKLSIRDHEPSPFREKEFGKVDHYEEVNDITDLGKISEAMTRLEDWLDKKGYIQDPVTRDASGAVIPLYQRFNPDSNDIRFSLAPRSLAETADTVLASRMRKPEFRGTFYTEARKRLDKIRTDGAWRVDKRGIASRRVGFDTKMAGVRSASNIENERKFRLRSRQRELIDAGLATLTPETMLAYDQGVASLEDHPLISSMLNDHGKLMSKTTALRLGKLKTDGKGNAGDYDDAPRLPISWYAKTDGIMPDVMATTNLGFDSVNRFWDALRSVIYSTRTQNEAFAKARDAVKDIETKALAQARSESDAWAKAETAKIPTEKERQMMALRTLDAILSAFPPEIRGRVGGFVKLASLGSDKAREAEIERRLEKLDEVVEKAAQKHYREIIKATFERYAAKREAGKKPVGQLDPDAQELVDAALAAMKLDDLGTAAEVARIDALLADPNISTERETFLQRQRELVQLFGDFDSRSEPTGKLNKNGDPIYRVVHDGADAARLEAAAEALQFTASEGWAKWKIRKLMEKERRDISRAALIADTGKPSNGKNRDAMNKWASTTFGKAFSGLLNISSFGELLRFEFGDKSAVARQLEDGERKAAYQYEDAMQAFGDRVGDFFEQLAGSRLAGEQLRFDLAQPTLTVGTGDNERNISAMQGIQALLMWQQEDGRRHMEGSTDENGMPDGAWHYGDAWIADLESKLPPEAYEVKRFLEQLYSEEYTPLNALYRSRHGVSLPKNERYSPITVQPMQAKAGEMVDPVSGFAVTGSILTPGALRARNKSAIAEPRFDDAVQIFLGHSRQMEHWKAYFDFATEAQAILLNRDVTNAVEAKGSTQAVTILKKWVDQFAQGGSRDAQAGLAISSAYQRISGRAARVALLGRISTLLIQSTQLAAASVKMPVGAYLKRLGLLLSGNLDYSGAVQSPFIQRRYKAAPPIVQQALAGLGTENRPGAMSSTTPRILGNALSGADALFTGGTYAMILDYHRTVTGPAMGLQGAELEAFARGEAERDTEAVAQPTRAGTRSIFENTLTSPLAKTGFAFASEARQKIALAAWSAYNAKKDPAQAAKVAILTFVVGGLGSQILKNLWREAKGDDDEKMWSAERLAKSLIAGPLHGVPGISELMGDPGLFSGLSWSAKGVQNIAEKALSGDIDEVTMRDIENALSAAGYFNDTAAGVSALSHAGFDFAKILNNLVSE